MSLDLDALARPVRFEAPDTEPWAASYLDSGELEEIVVGTAENLRRTLFGYDVSHRLVTVEDAEERIVTFSYDDVNRVTSTLLPDGKAVGFQYDANGNVTQVTPPGKPAHVFTYTPRNQLSTYTLPDAGSGTAVEERIYDSSKRLQEVRRPDGKVIGFGYKENGERLERIVSPRGETRFGYNTVNGLISDIEEPDGQKLSFQYHGLLLPYDDNSNRLGYTGPLGDADVIVKAEGSALWVDDLIFLTSGGKVTGIDSLESCR